MSDTEDTSHWSVDLLNQLPQAMESLKAPPSERFGRLIWRIYTLDQSLRTLGEGSLELDWLGDELGGLLELTEELPMGQGASHVHRVSMDCGPMPWMRPLSMSWISELWRKRLGEVKALTSHGQCLVTRTSLEGEIPPGLHGVRLPEDRFTTNWALFLALGSLAESEGAQAELEILDSVQFLATEQNLSPVGAWDTGAEAGTLQGWVRWGRGCSPVVYWLDSAGMVRLVFALHAVWVLESGEEAVDGN